MATLLQRLPDAAELHAVWDTQLLVSRGIPFTALAEPPLLTSDSGSRLLSMLVSCGSALQMKDSKIATELLLAVAELLSRPEMSHQEALGEGQGSSPAEKLAASVLGGRMKSLYHFLGSGNPALANAVFTLLTAVVLLGPGLATDLVQAFDFSLPAYSKAALPPRCRPTQTSTMNIEHEASK